MTKTTFLKTLTDLYQQHFGVAPLSVELLPASGSDRRYLRLIGEAHNVIGAFNPDKKENNTFFYFTGIFQRYQLPVSTILAESPDKQYYLLEDLGPDSLFDIMKKEGHTERVKLLFKKSIDQLAKIHWEAGNDIDYSHCFAAGEFDRKQIFADLLYFKYYFADLMKVGYNKTALLEELEDWSRSLAAARPQTFMYRDFQSRNVMIKDEEVYFIDYQGGMLGLPQYDLVSLLWQARAQLPKEWKQELLNYYLQAISKMPHAANLNETDFRKVYLDCVLLRILQTLGAYGYRGLLEKKPHFIKSIRPALQQLKAFLDEYGHLPVHVELRKVLEGIVRPEITSQFEDKTVGPEATLQVKVYSFSYKKGLPADDSGHGGGFVFDCRGILNPGRFEEYKSLTGKDRAVIDFLEHKTRMPEFIDELTAAVDIAVEDYLARGFDRLSISFGCTGGQHRSVYAAEKMAEHLREKYGLKAELLHLEQDEHTHKRR